ncbi:phage protein Gp36 family protein [Sulfurimonas sp.]|uniref:phage protein Gp36 family protein n=1 Tax=Sulfurimonas sp. TaxID=2022749 RepID=UPI0025EAA767|nr:phage protein Gp36 family protein [Sulfurimonas sp.]
MIINKDLLKEISSQQLQELSDINATGEINQSVIDDASEDAISFIQSFIVIPDNPTPLLKKISVDLTIFELKRKNELTSDEDKELKKECEAYLLKMSNGRLKTEVTSTSTASIDEMHTNFSFRHKNRRRVKTRGFR